MTHHPNRLSKWPLFFALSRTHHGLIDMTGPFMAALLWLGALPPPMVILLGMVTVFAGYTAVYALNDIVDYQNDRKKADAGEFALSGGDLDAVLVRHPMAQGLLDFKAGAAWAAVWALVTMIGAWMLNPACLWIFLGGCLLEAVYCLLWNKSPYRAVINGIVKTLGAVAAVYAVDPAPHPTFVAALFLMLFFWEIGGQNIPNDWTDIAADRKWGAATIPVRFTPKQCQLLIIGSLLLTLLFCRITFGLSSKLFGTVHLLLATVCGVGLLIWPAIRLLYLGSADAAMVLFNRASYYPMALLSVVLLKMLTG